MDTDRSIASKAVNTAPQAVQRRRRQTWLVRFWGRLLKMSKLPPQYMQTMTTCCHDAIEKASGKLTVELWVMSQLKTPRTLGRSAVLLVPCLGIYLGRPGAADSVVHDDRAGS